MSTNQKITIGNMYYVTIVLIPVVILVVSFSDYVKNVPIKDKFVNDQAAIQLLREFYDYSDKSLCQKNIISIDITSICVESEYQVFRTSAERGCIDPFCKIKHSGEGDMTPEGTTRIYLFDNGDGNSTQTISNSLVNVAGGCFKNKNIMLSWCIK